MATLNGELKIYHPIFVDFTGPSVNETSNPNPFTDYYFFVTFSKGSKSYRVPGFFAADGNAAITSATSGNVWRAAIVLDEVGTWTYSAEFRTGSNIGQYSSGTHGSTTSFHGESGTITVADTDKVGEDLRSKGVLEYVNSGFLRFSNGEYWLKGGVDSPENFLAYYQFDNTYNQSGGLGTACLPNDIHEYQPHSGDYNSDGDLWNGKGANIYGALNYLASRGVNSLYAISYNIDGGDGRDVWPWTGNGSDKTRFDVSKLAQWDRVMRHANKKGIVWHFLLGEVENQGQLGINTLNRRVYYKEMVARFGYLNGLYWNLGEEMSGMGDGDKRDLADILKGFNGYSRSISYHTQYDLGTSDYKQNNSSTSLSTTSFQGGLGNAHNWAKDMRSNPFNDGRNWVVMFDEQGPIARDYSGREDEFIDGYHALITAGGIGAEWYAGYAGSGNDCNGYDDIQTENFRSIEPLVDLTTRQIAFYKQNNIPWWSMTPDDNHTSAKYGLKKDGEYYVGFNTGGSVTLTLASGDYEVKWYNPRNGGVLQTGSVSTVSGGGSRNIGQPPSDTSNQWLYLVKSTTIVEQDCDCTTSSSSFVGSPQGLIVIPAEQPTNGLVGSWKLNPYGNLIGTVGDYIGWDAPGNEFNNAGTDVLEYTFTPCTTGVYQLAIRSHIDPNSSDVTEGNDGWVTIDTPNEADFYGELNGQIYYPVGSGESPTVNTNGGSNGYFKFFQNTANQWEDLTQVFEGNGFWDFRAKANLIKGQTYTLKISGRSTGFCIDRIMLFDEALQTYQNAVDVSKPSSACGSGSSGSCVSDLSVNCGSSSNTLSWSIPSGYTGFFNVERSSDNGNNWVVIASGLSSITTTYTDSNISSSLNYVYRLVCSDEAPSGGVKVITIFVDGLNDETLSSTLVGSPDINVYTRLRNEGMSTFEAYSDYDNTTTLPNYISMVTGRTVEGEGAHNWTQNGASGSDAVPVDSIFDVVRAAGKKSVMLCGKSKIKVITDNSWGGLNLATYLDDDATNVNTWVNNAPTEKWDYSMIHLAAPDNSGHNGGWNSSQYLDAIRDTNNYIGQIMNVVDNDPEYKNNTWVIITADHGGNGTSHGTPSDPDNYGIPFIVWGPRIAAPNGDLYANNTNSRQSNGGNRKELNSSSATNVIFNADQANLATDLLGLPPITGSVVNVNQDLKVDIQNWAGGGSGSTKILHFTKTNGYDHGTRNLSLSLFQSIASTHGYTVVQDDSGAEFDNLNNLLSYSVIIFSNTSGSSVLTGTRLANYKAFIQAGGSQLGIHAASDTMRHPSSGNSNSNEDPFYAETLGVSIACCPNHGNADQLANLTKLIPTHPSVINIPGGNTFSRREEYYYWSSGGYLRNDLQTVVQVESTGNETYQQARPHSMYRDTGYGGKSFYTAMGHDTRYWETDTIFQQHLEDALVWLMDTSNNQTQDTTNLQQTGYSNTVSCSGSGSPTLNATCGAVTESTIPLTFSYSGNNTGQLLIIERSVNQVSWVTVANVNPFSVSSFTDTGLNAGTLYYYRAKYGGGGIYSSVVSCTTSGSGSSCSVSNLGVDCNAGYPTLTWTYTGDTTGAQVTIHRSIDGSNYSQLAAVNATETTYNDLTATTEGQQYWYIICCPTFTPNNNTQTNNTSGECEYGMLLNGQGQGLEIPSPINLANKSFTIEFTVQLDRNIVAEGWKDVIFSHQGTNTKFNFQGGKMRWFDGSQDILTGNQSITVGTPVHVGITFNQSTGLLSFYQNGNFNGSTTISTSKFSGVSIDSIGAKGTDQSVLGGVDEFRFHNVAKPASYFLSFYNQRYNEAASEFDSVQLAYQFIDDEGADSITDVVGSNDATVNIGGYSHFDFGASYFLADSSICAPPVVGCSNTESCVVPVDVPAPELVAQCAFVTQTTITLGFSYQGATITGESLILERSLDTNIWLEIATFSTTDTEYVDSGLMLDTQYYYRLKYNGGPYSQTVTCTTLASGASGGALDLQCFSGGLSSIDLRWEYTDETVVGGQVTLQRSEDFGTWTTIATKVLPSGKIDSYVDSGLVDNTVYYYRAKYSADSGYSNVVSCSTGMQTGEGCTHQYSLDGGVTWKDFSNGLNTITITENIIESLGILLKEDCGDGCIKIFGPFFPTTTPAVVLNELSVCDKWVEIYNPSSQDVDISNYYLCNYPNCVLVSNLTIQAGSYNVQPGGYAVLGFPPMGSTTGEVALYKNNTDFSNPANLVDYVQYNAANNSRASVAVSAGVWDNVQNFVSADTEVSCTSIGIFGNMSPTKGTDTDSSSWCTQLPSPNDQNEDCIEIVANAIDDVYTTDKNTPITEDVSANDFECSTGITTWGLITGSVTNGTVGTFNTSTGVFTFTPTLDFEGTASFQYNLLCDGVIADTATVTITVLGDEEPNIQLRDPSAALVDCGNLTIDFGTIAEGSTKNVSFQIINTGTATLSVSDLGIAGTDFEDFTIITPTPPFTILSGSTINVNVQFAPQTDGAKTATLNILSNDPDTAICTVNLQGNATVAEGELEITNVSGTVLTCGVGSITINAAVGQSAQGTIRVHNVGTGNLVLDTFVLGGANPGLFTILAPNSLPVTIAPNDTQDIDIQFSPTTSGTFNGNITIGNNDSDEDDCVINIIGAAEQPDINILNDVGGVVGCGGTVAFGTQVANATVNQQIFIKNIGTSTLTINSIVVSGQHYTITGVPNTPFTLGAGVSQGINVLYNPTTEGTHVGTVIINSNATTSSTCVVNLTGNVQTTGTNGEIDILDGTTSVGCGSTFSIETDVNVIANTTITIKNEGSGALIVSDLEIAGIDDDKFVITSPNGVALPITIQPGDTLPVVVAFQHDTAGTYTDASLIITNTDQNEGNCTVNLEGVIDGGVQDILGTFDGQDYDCGEYVNYGTINITETVPYVVSIKNIGVAPLTVSNITLTGAGAGQFTFTNPFTFPITVGAGLSSSDFNVNFTPTTEGVKNAVLTITSNDPNEPTCVFNLQGVAKVPVSGPGELLIHNGDEVDIPCGTTIDLGTVGILPEQLVYELHVQNIGTGALEIIDHSLSGAGVGAYSVSPAENINSITLSPQATQIYTITVDSSVEGTFEAALTFTSDDDDEGTCIINFTVDVSDPELQVTNDFDDSVLACGSGVLEMSDFGAISLNTVSTATVTLENVGSTSDLIITSIGILGVDSDKYSLITNITYPLTLAPAATQQLTIEFETDVEGSFTSTLSIVSNDNSSTPCLIDLSANISAPEIQVVDVTDVDRECGIYTLNFGADSI